MIKIITSYPTKPSLEFGANVRNFDESLLELIQDLKDTIQHNNIDALSAYQIGSPLSVIVIKHDNKYLELINPIIIKREGNVETIEKTAYFPNLSAKTKRYEKIKIIYEDAQAKEHHLEADGELSIIIQRKIDYAYGSNFRIRLDKDEKKLFDAKLEFGTDSITQSDCPTVFKRDRILHTFKYSFIAGIIGIISSFFLSNENILILKDIQNYIMIFMLITIVIYFFYAQHEGKQYKQCTSCQIGNIIGTVIISFVKLSLLFILNYFLVY